MKNLLTLLALLWAGLAARPASAAAPHGASALVAATTAFYQKFVDAQGLVNYAAIKRNPLELKALVRQIETLDLAPLSENDRKAFTSMRTMCWW